VTYRWHKPVIPQPHPLPRRAHTAVLYGTKMYIFGGGNGHRALNDVWCLDLSVPSDKLKWEQIHIHGTKPSARGYHTANLVGQVMVVLGGSDGRECFSDVWLLDLGDFLFPTSPHLSLMRLCRYIYMERSETGQDVPTIIPFFHPSRIVSFRHGRT